MLSQLSLVLMQAQIYVLGLESHQKQVQDILLIQGILLFLNRTHLFNDFQEYLQSNLDLDFN